MNTRKILNGAAALAAVGVFYTFATLMVDDVDTNEISKEYQFDTNVDTIHEMTDRQENAVTEAPAQPQTEAATTQTTAVTTADAVRELPELPEDEDSAFIKVLNDNDYDYQEVKTEIPARSPVTTPIYSNNDEEEPVQTSVPVQEETEVTEIVVTSESKELQIAEKNNEPEPVVTETTTAFKEEINENDEDEDVFYPEEDDDDNSGLIYSENLLDQQPQEPIIEAVTTTYISVDDIQERMEQLAQEFYSSNNGVSTVPDGTYTDDGYVSSTGITYESTPAHIKDNSITTTVVSDYTGSASITNTVVNAPSGEIFTAKVEGSIQEFDAYELVCMICSIEMSPSFSPEALKAQAICAYSYVKYHNVNGLVPSVVVKRKVPAEVVAAVDSVFGKCVYYNGKVAETVYSASSAGTTAAAANLWGGDYPYLLCVETPFDAESDPNYGLTFTYSEDEMRSKLENYLGITLSDTPENWMTILSRVDGKYVSQVNIDDQYVISGKQMREGVFSYSLKSWAFDVSYADGYFTFTTYGYGHGVGMSQNGANILGNKGWSCEEILALYFPGTTVE